MPAFDLVALATRRDRRFLAVRPSGAPDPLARVDDQGIVACLSRPWSSTVRSLLAKELRQPEVLVDQIERDLDADAPRPDADRWRVVRLYLAVHRELAAAGTFERESDRFTRTLLLVLGARASLRAFLAASSAAPESWRERAAEDLLDATVALEYFEPARLTPLLHWLVAVLPRRRAAELLDRLLPVEEKGFADRLTQETNRELARVVEGVARAQRRQWCLGRYDLAGARRLAPLLARLRFPQSNLWSQSYRVWIRLVDSLVPRILAGCLVGILPFLITDEAWRLATDRGWSTAAGLLGAAVLGVFAYLAYDRQVADPAGLGSARAVLQVGFTGLVEALAFAGLLQCFAAKNFHKALEIPPGWNWAVFLASAAFSLGVGVFTQLIWQEKAVTAPP